MVLHLGQQDLVALADTGASPSVGHQVQCFGSVTREDDALFRGSVDETRHLAADRLVGLSRLLAQLVDGTMDVGVVVLVVVHQRVDDLSRLLRGRRIVQIDQRPAVHLARKDGEVAPDASDVEAVAHRLSPPSASAAASWASRKLRTAFSGTRSMTSSANPLTRKPIAVSSSRPRLCM